MMQMIIKKKSQETTIALANVLAASNDGVTARVVIDSAPGVVFESDADLVIGSTTVVLANVNKATEGTGTSTETTDLLLE